MSAGPCATSGGAAFFDLDGTLIEDNTGHLYARYEHRLGTLDTATMLRASGFLLLHRLSLLDIEAAFQRAARHWEGRDAAEVEAGVRAWFAREVEHLLLPGARAAIAHHRQRGEPIVLLTNSSSHIARAACEQWGFDDWLANLIPADADGKLVGQLQLPLCFGEGKVKRARAWLRDRQLSLAHSTFYTDSLSDLPMLRAVGHPRVVQPDPRLRLQALLRRWPVLDWRHPTP